MLQFLIIFLFLCIMDGLEHLLVYVTMPWLVRIDIGDV